MPVFIFKEYIERSVPSQFFILYCVRQTAAEVDWPSIKGLRNIIVHEYGKVKLQVLWDIVSEDVPRLKEFCERYLPEDF